MTRVKKEFCLVVFRFVMCFANVLWSSSSAGQSDFVFNY